jgi:hypothetical protein
MGSLCCNVSSFEIFKFICECFLTIATVAISIIALCTSKRFNRQSVRPIAEIHICDYEDDVSVSLRNVGTGPLTVKSFSCSNKRNKSESLVEVVNLIITYMTFEEELVDRTLPPNESIVLIRLKSDKKEHIQLLRKELGSITIRLEYKNIYGNSFELTKSLDYFERHNK